MAIRPSPICLFTIPSHAHTLAAHWSWNSLTINASSTGSMASDSLV